MKVYTEYYFLPTYCHPSWIVFQASATASRTYASSTSLFQSDNLSWGGEHDKSGVWMFSDYKSGCCLPRVYHLLVKKETNWKKLPTWDMLHHVSMCHLVACFLNNWNWKFVLLQLMQELKPPCANNCIISYTFDCIGKPHLKPMPLGALQLPVHNHLHIPHFCAG